MPCGKGLSLCVCLPGTSLNFQSFYLGLTTRRNTTCAKRAVPPKISYRFNTIPNNLPTWLFVGPPEKKNRSENSSWDFLAKRRLSPVAKFIVKIWWVSGLHTYTMRQWTSWPGNSILPKNVLREEGGVVNQCEGIDNNNKKKKQGLRDNE